MQITKTHIELTAIDRNGKEKKKEIKISTEPLPFDFSQIKVAKKIPEQMAEGFTFFNCPHLNGNYPFAIDQDGEVRWYLADKSLNGSVMMAHLKNGNVLVSSGKVIPGTYNNLSSVYEITPLGKFIAEYGLYGIHHDVREKQNGDLIFAASKEGSPSQNDYIVEVQRNTGKILRTWDLKEILPMTKYDTQPPYSGGLSNWLHNNAICYLEKEDAFIISGRHQNLIAKFDAKTKEIKWAFSETIGHLNPEIQKYLLTPEGTDFEYPTSQHAATILPDGRLMLFDNRNQMEKPKEGESLDQSKLYSRAVIYSIDEDKKTIHQDWQYGKDHPNLYSSFVSDVDYLDKSHYLIDFGGIYKAEDASNYDHIYTPSEIKNTSDKTSVIVELVNNEVVFEATMFGGNNSNSYKAERTNIYRNAKEAVLGQDSFQKITCK